MLIVTILTRFRSHHRIRAAMFAGLVLLMPCFVLTQAAALGQSITASPTSELITIKPGGVSSGSVQVLNQGSSAYSFEAYVTPYRVTSEAYTPNFTQLAGAPHVASWFHLSTTSGHLAAGQNLGLPYKISVPAVTPAGGYYATVFAETEGGSAHGGVVLHERVGTIFYITVSGKLKTQGNLLSFQSSFLQSPPLLASLRIENSGNVHFPVTLNAKVTDIFGKTKFSQYTVKEVLPQTIRTIPVTWLGASSFGLVKLAGNVQYLGSSHVLKTHYVLLMSTPVRIALLLILVLIIAGIIGFVARSRKHKKSHLKNSHAAS